MKKSKKEEVEPIITSPEKDMQHIMAMNWKRNLLLSLPLIAGFALLGTRLYSLLSSRYEEGVMLAPQNYSLLILLSVFILIYGGFLVYYYKHKRS